ncbi:hypothetical protein BDY19DRAFT_997132 [Irpex rosettiformis]|uniref:Uncharacterized protein n=1 Tax=Irpex rosettiformis TaxID=378272 RepID=A0ACB8TT73_9APHY|nr:hypothetical protein BDY19DRAFT_997132 [Irpex rosettiformis]
MVRLAKNKPQEEESIVESNAMERRAPTSRSQRKVQSPTPVGSSTRHQPTPPAMLVPGSPTIGVKQGRTDDESEDGNQEKTARLRISDVEASVDETEAVTEKNIIQSLAKKVERAWPQRQQIEEMRALTKTDLAGKVELYHIRRNWGLDLCLAAMMEGSLNMNVPQQEVPIEGSSQHSDAYAKTENGQQTTESGILLKTPAVKPPK